MVQTQKKIALLHRYPWAAIKETNAAFPFLHKKGVHVLTFNSFDKLNSFKKFWKSLWWILYAPSLVAGKRYDVIYCDDSYPFYPALVKLVSPKSKVVIRLGDLHLMYNYSGIVYKFLHFLEKISWCMADNILPISDAMGDYISNEVRVDNINVILDPVNPSDFPVGCYSKGINGGVMFHGLITKNKNVDIMLEAAARLPDTDFVIAGDGPDMSRLKKIAPPNVYFTGWIPFKDIHQQISQCSIGVALRSDNPGNEYVVTSPFLQYGVMGKPCLVTRRKVFGRYRWQFSGVDEMVEKIKILMQNPFQGANLKEYILQNHDAEKIAEEIWSQLQS